MPYVQWTSAATANSTAGVSVANQTRLSYYPMLTTQLRTDTVITLRRIWVALSSASLATATGDGATTTRYIGLRYDASLGDVNWMCGSGDGTTGSLLDTGVAVSASTAYRVVIDATNWPASFSCTVNGVTVTKTDYIDSTGTTALTLYNQLTTLDATGRIHRAGYIRLKYSGNDF
jgi:hypothetical protein